MDALVIICNLCKCSYAMYAIVFICNFMQWCSYTFISITDTIECIPCIYTDHVLISYCLILILLIERDITTDTIHHFRQKARLLHTSGFTRNLPVTANRGQSLRMNVKANIIEGCGRNNRGESICVAVSDESREALKLLMSRQAIT